MEYSIYINQKAAIDWDLTMGESIMFAYLISSGVWMTPLANDPEYRWASNSKLATELPLVCVHQGSARRHMAALEGKGVIDRLVSGNKSYFKITEKGLQWKSPTLSEANESVQPVSEGKPNGSAKANGSVRAKANQMVRRSDIPSLSVQPVSETDKGSSEKRGLEKHSPPDWMPSRKWADYLESRRDKKHPMSRGALELCVDAIEATVKTGVSIDEVMNRMIEAGWRTVKPDWFQRQNGKLLTNGRADNSELAAKVAAEMRAGMSQ